MFDAATRTGFDLKKLVQLYENLQTTFRHASGTTAGRRHHSAPDPHGRVMGDSWASHGRPIRMGAKQGISHGACRVM